MALFKGDAHRTVSSLLLLLTLPSIASYVVYMEGKGRLICGGTYPDNYLKITFSSCNLRLEYTELNNITQFYKAIH